MSLTDYETYKAQMLASIARGRVLGSVTDELNRQDDKWGEQNHSPADWLAILGEEVGEANQAYLNARFGGDTYDNMVEELVQVAAVAIQFVLSVRRQGLA